MCPHGVILCSEGRGFAEAAADVPAADRRSARYVSGVWNRILRLLRLDWMAWLIAGERSMIGVLVTLNPKLVRLYCHGTHCALV